MFYISTKNAFSGIQKPYAPKNPICGFPVCNTQLGWLVPQNQVQGLVGSRLHPLYCVGRCFRLWHCNVAVLGVEPLELSLINNWNLKCEIVLNSAKYI